MHDHKDDEAAELEKARLVCPEPEPEDIDPAVERAIERELDNLYFARIPRCSGCGQDHDFCNCHEEERPH